MKRRFLSVALVLIMMMNLLAVTAFAEENATLEASTDTFSLKVGDAVTVTAIVPQVSGIASGYLKLNFDKETLEVQTINAPTTFAGYATTVTGISDANSTGTISISIGNGASTNFDMTESLSLSATFVVRSEATTGDKNNLVAVDMNNYYFEDENSEEVTAPTFSNTAISGKVVEPAVAPYTASISTTDDEFTVDDTVKVTVNVGGTEGKFASSELTLTYDPDYLTLNKADDGTYESKHTLNGAGIEVDETNGTIKLVDHGEDNAYPDAYVLNFTAKAATTGAAELITLTDAKFSTAENAISSDLTEAEGENALSLTINNADLNVDLTNASAVDGNTSVPYGADYTFTAKNNTTYMYYDYEVTVTMGGTDVTESATFSNGTWTVSDVTDDLVIEVIETPKTFSVTWDGNSKDEVTNITGISNEGKATYNTNITFTVPADKEASGNTESSYSYSVTAKLTESGDTVSVNKVGTDVTIVGTEIKGAITITVTKNTVEATHTTISIDNADVKATVNDVEVTDGLVKKGEDVVLDLTREPGYTYTIEVNGEDKTTEFDNDDSYTISNVQSPVTVVVTKTFDLSSANVQKYLTLNETNMWLVTINGNGDTEISGKTYSYDGQNMYWSPKYQAYCYLVVATELSVDDAKTEIGTTLVEADATKVEYNMDVNNTSGKVDANDAQLVYNMYQTKAYDNFTTVEMIKFLEADLNTTVGVDSTDAQVIIDYILAN